RRQVARGTFDDLAEPFLLLAEPLEQDRHVFVHLALRALNLVGGFVAAGDEKLGQLHTALGELLVDARARRGKVAGDLLTHAAQGLAYPLAVVGERLALARSLGGGSARGRGAGCGCKSARAPRPRCVRELRARRRVQWRARWHRSSRPPAGG